MQLLAGLVQGISALGPCGGSIVALASTCGRRYLWAVLYDTADDSICKTLKQLQGPKVEVAISIDNTHTWIGNAYQNIYAS